MFQQSDALGIQCHIDLQHTSIIEQAQCSHMKIPIQPDTHKRIHTGSCAYVSPPYPLPSHEEACTCHSSTPASLALSTASPM